MKLIFAAIAVVAISCLNVNANTTNIALGKKYTIAPNPNYSLCTEPGDMNQLTDGKKYGSDWCAKTTVGWQWMKTTPEIIIDLEKPSLIEEICVFTIGGGRSGVHYPDYVVAMASIDGKKYEIAGFANLRGMVMKSQKEFNKIPYTIKIRTPDCRGRYVKLLLQSSSVFIFIDELEIWGTPDKSKGASPETKDREYLSSKDSAALIEELIDLKQAIDKTSKAVSQEALIIGQSNYTTLFKRLGNIANDINSIEGPKLTRKTIEHYQSAFAQIKSDIYKCYYGSPYAVLVSNPMNMLLASDIILDKTETTKNVKISAWQKEYESAAVNIINCSPQPVSFTVSLSSLVNDNNSIADANQCFSIRRAVFVNGKRTGRNADALVLNKTTPFNLQHGEACQIWLTFFNPTLTAGRYRSNLSLTAKTIDGNSLPNKSIPLEVTIESITFNHDIALNTCNWAYPKNCAITQNYLSEAADDLRSHYINVIVIPPQMLPTGRTKATFADLDQYLDKFSFARTYLFFMNFNSLDTRDYFSGKFMTAEWQKNFSGWLAALTSHLKNRNIDYSHYAIYLYDEQLGSDFFNIATVIKRADPNLRIYANSFGNGTSEINKLKNLVDIWCPQINHSDSNPQLLSLVRSFTKEVWSYGANNPADAKPYEYYRLMAWKAFKRGQNGCGFWVYADEGQVNPWDELMLPRGHYGVIYPANGSPVPTEGEKIITSRRWEAWREGVEDYQYLYELQTKINSLKGRNPQKSDEVQKILDGQVDFVLNNIDDSDAVYKARHIITTSINDLK